MSVWRIRVVAGPDKGEEILLTDTDVSVGRAADNDLVLTDSDVALYHARLHPDPDGGPEFEDLYSEAGATVDGAPVERGPLRHGSRIRLGATELEILADDGPPVDLGLAPGTRRPSRPIPRLIAGLFGLAAAVAGAWWFLGRAGPEPTVAPQGQEPFSLRYEKVQAGSGNIFRYALHITPWSLAAEVDDLAQNRHLRREAALPAGAARHLVRQLEEAGFFELEPVQRGKPGDLSESTTLEVVIGTRSHSVVVANRLLPDALESVRGAVEQFGENELGLVALSLSAEEATARAAESLVKANKLYHERDVSFGNLYESMCASREVQWYLEPIEPKPDAYREAVHMESLAAEELNRRIDDQRFLAEKSVQLRDWRGASEALRTIVELIPDRADERNENARRKLMDVERRLKGR